MFKKDFDFKNADVPNTGDTVEAIKEQIKDSLATHHHIIIIQNGRYKLVDSSSAMIEDESAIAFSSKELDCKLLRGSYVTQQFYKMERYQDTPKDAFIDYSSARFIIAISHKWMNYKHPDIEGIQSKEIQNFVNDMAINQKLVSKSGILLSLDEVGVFIDFQCLPQKSTYKDCSNYAAEDKEPFIERTEEENKIFQKTLSQMNFIYALSDVVFCCNYGKEGYLRSSWCIMEQSIGDVMGKLKGVTSNDRKIVMSNDPLVESRRLLSGSSATNQSDVKMIEKMLASFLNFSSEIHTRLKNYKRPVKKLTFMTNHTMGLYFNRLTAEMEFVETKRPFTKEDVSNLEKNLIKTIGWQYRCDNKECVEICECCDGRLLKGTFWTFLCFCPRYHLVNPGYMWKNKPNIPDYHHYPNDSKSALLFFKPYPYKGGYKTIASNIEEDVKRIIRNAYTNFADFIHNNESGFIDEQVLTLLEKMNAIELYKTDEMWKPVRQQMD